MKETFGDRPPRYTGYEGEDFGDHLDFLRYREQAYPQARDAEYKPSSTKGRRKLTIGGLPANKDLDGSGSDVGGVHEEKGPASLGLIPVNHVGKIPPASSGWGSKKASDKRDSGMMRSLTKKANKEDATVRLRSHPENKDAPIGPVLPLRSKYVPGFPKPVDEQFDDSDTFFEATDRSASPRSDGSRSYKLRDSPGRRRDRPSKRDIVDSASSQESNQESTAPDTNNDFKQEYQQFLQAYGVVQSNATEIIMPLVEEMVDGHNSTLVWGAAWEILSLVNPSVMVTGPFLHGMHAFDYYEDLIRNTTDNETMTSIIAIDDFLIDLYQITWNKAYDALNSSGVMYDLDVLGQCLESNNTSVADIKEDPTTTESINDFFLNYLDSPLTELSKDDSTWSVVSNSTPGDNSTFDGGWASGGNGPWGHSGTWSHSSAYLAGSSMGISISTAVSRPNAVSLAGLVPSITVTDGGAAIVATTLATATDTRGSTTPALKS